MPLPAPGTLLAGRYELERALGEGGSATTFLVHDELRGGPLALKLLGESDVGAELAASFRAEFARLTRLSHPHLVRVHDFGALALGDQRRLFYTADAIDGVTLDTFARGRAWHELAQPVAHAVAALAALHAAGIRHGDFKPANVLVTTTGPGAPRGVLIDLGCARALDAPPDALVSGTPRYLAPELMDAGGTGAPSARSDLYAVGVTLREVVALASGPVPANILRLVERLTAHDPRARPSDAREVGELLGTEPLLAATSSGEPPALVGRARELQSARALLDALVERRSAPRTLCVAGEEGIGKSRLLREIKWDAELRASVVEGAPDDPRCVFSMLERALVISQTGSPRRVDSFAAAVEAREEIVRRLASAERDGAPATLVLVLDDAHRLTDDQRACVEALVRASSNGDPLAIVLAERSTGAPSLPCGVALSLAPLDAADVARWARSFVPEHVLDDVARWTGGVAALVRLLCAGFASGTLREGDLAGHAAMAALGDAHARFASASTVARRALGLLALCDRALGSREARALRIDEATIDELVRAGWARSEEGALRLARAADGRAVLDAMDVSLVAELAHELVEHLDLALGREPGRDDLAADRVLALAVADDLDRAETQLRARLARSSPLSRRWQRAADALADRRPTARVRSAQAAIRELRGDPASALSVLARWLRATPTADGLFALRLRAGAAYLRLGRLSRAQRQLGRARELASTPEERAEVADLVARTFIQQRDYSSALATAQDALTDELELEGSAAPDPRLRAALLDDVGVAAMYLGDAAAAREHLGLALGAHERTGDVRAQVRTLSALAILEYRDGHPARAAQGHRRALDLAENNGLADQMASAALNLGTACHQQGEWGRALASYERSLRLTIALGRVATTATVEWNLAKLYADIGSLERAEAQLTRADASARAAGSPALGAVRESLLADIASARGEPERAAEHLRRAMAMQQSSATARELSELELELAGALLDSGEDDRALAHVASARARSGTLAAPDLRARLALVDARAKLGAADAPEAISLLEDALDAARSAGQRALEAEIEGGLANACDATGADSLGREHRSRARLLWERIAATLPAALRDALWRHPLRAALAHAGAPIEHAVEPRAGAPEDAVVPEAVKRLLEINRQLGESLDVDGVLRATMDAAIELTGAERGFLILAPARDDERGEYDVAIARNLDRERIGKSHLKLSRSIAERVLATGEPLLTVDALEDERFRSNASVHAMRLRSVVAVPIRTREATLGALYLDNRFQRGRFRPQDTELLLAFADQVAIALRNARLKADLEARTRQLEAERKRIERMVRDQALQIDRLTEEVRARQDALEHRFDYSHIVGTSRAMQAVFTVLDRVIDTTLSVLIEGESGTGKELVARAIHYNGPRKKAPFVTVSCAALPDTLLESELFGHVRGAFTGAVRDRVGLFVAARGGTLFLDEIGETSPAMQVKLLRALQEREVRPVGATADVAIDVRVVCATNRDLRDEVARGRFREDLFYRIGVVELRIPPLRERADDIPAIAAHVLTRVASAHHREPAALTPQAMRKLSSYTWPGNVRQLENVLSKALVLADGDRIAVTDIDLPAHAPRAAPAAARNRRDYESTEAERILDALHAHAWNVCEVSRALGIPRTTLYRKLQKHGLRREPDRSGA